MKKILIFSAVLVALLAVGGAALVVNAQTPEPQGNSPFSWSNEDGQYGMFGHRGMMGRGGWHMGAYEGYMGNGEFGPMHETMLTLLADATGLSVDEINQRIADGEHMYEIASDAGLSEDEIAALMEQAHADFWNNAGTEEDGWFQQHFDRMQQRWSENGEEFTPGSCHGGFGRGGFGGPMMDWDNSDF